MALNLSVPENTELRPRITVFGVGGAGGNAVDNMIEKQLEGAEFVVANTDAQALQQSTADRRCCDQALPVRRRETHEPGRARHRGAAKGC